MEGLLDLPPGFRFHPTDEEVIVDYLRKKVLDGRFNSIAIAEVDLNKCEPWDLSTKNGDKELYVFYHKDRKYPTGSRTNRATKSGYWKATGKDKAIYKGKGNLVGMKKTLVFYKGRAPRGGKTNWVMHEFRLEGKFYKNLKGTEKDEWVVCRVINKSDGPMDQMITTNPIPSYFDQNHDLYDIQTLPPLIDAPYPDTTVTTLPYSIPFNNNNSSSCTDHTGDFKYFSPNDVLQPNRTTFIPPSITLQTTFNPQFTFNNPYTTHPPYVSTSPILSIDPTPISMDNFQYLHQDGSINGFIDPNQTTQISKEEETLDFLFTDPVLGMHRSQSAEDISDILSFDGLFGGAPFSKKF